MCVTSPLPPGSSPADPDVATLLKGLAFGLCAATLAAGWMVFTRMGVQGAVGVADMTMMRYAVAGLVLLPVVLRQGIAIGRRGWLGIAIMIVGAGVPYHLLATGGVVFAPARHAGALIPGTMPFFAAMLGLLFLGERLTRRRSAGLALIFVGFLLIGGLNLLYPTGQQSIGHAMFLAASFAWAAFAAAMRFWKVGAVHAVAIVSVISAAVYLPPYFLFWAGGLWSAPAGELVFQTVYQGLVMGVVSTVFFSRAVGLLGAGRGTAIMAMVPVMATLLAIPVLGEWPTLADCAAIAAICSGVVLATGARWRTRG
jgi:drug/metabolite transporter (DMT)-like permease